MATAVPAFAADNTNAGLEITDGTPPVTQTPVAVGVDDTVNFVASTTTGTDQHEGVPPGLKSETLVINAPNGVISAMSAQGFGSAVITNGGATATITGYPSAASFPVGATLEYPDGNGGDQTVTCTGQLLFNDGTTTNSNPDGSVKITAVQVNSVALADDPTQVKLGQTLTRKDFNMITQPTGYGNFTYPSSDGSGPGAYLVDFSPASFAVEIGDNPVLATCGKSSADLDVVGVDPTGDWGAISADASNGTAAASFTAEIQGDTGTFQASGSVVGGDTNGSLLEGVPFNGNIDVADQASPGYLGDAGMTVTPDTNQGYDSVLSVFIHAEAYGIPELALDNPPGTVNPPIPQVLEWDAVNPAIFNPKVIQAQAVATVGGCSFDIGALGNAVLAQWADSPSGSVTVQNCNSPVAFNSVTNANDQIWISAGLVPNSQITFLPLGQDCSHVVVSPPNCQLMEKQPPLFVQTSFSLQGRWNLATIKLGGEIEVPRFPNGQQDLVNWAVPKGGENEADFSFSWDN